MKVIYIVSKKAEQINDLKAKIAKQQTKGHLQVKYNKVT